MACLPNTHLLEDGRRSHHPARADARREDLRERAQVDHVGVAVQGEQGGQRLALVAENPVGIVLHDQQVALGGQLHQTAAALERERRSPRVAEVGHDVEELGPPALRGQPVDQGFELVHHQAGGVHGSVQHGGLIGAEGGERAGVRGPLGQDHVTRVDEGLGHQVDGLLAPGGDQDVGRVDPRRPRRP